MESPSSGARHGATNHGGGGGTLRGVGSGLRGASGLLLRDVLDRELLAGTMQQRGVLQRKLPRSSWKRRLCGQTVVPCGIDSELLLGVRAIRFGNLRRGSAGWSERSTGV